MPAGADAHLFSDDLCALGTLDPEDPTLGWLDIPGGGQGPLADDEGLPSLSDLEEWTLLPSAPPPLQLRCLDPTHPPTCAMCSPAPSAERHSQFELTGDGGTKHLRMLVVGTEEWGNSHARELLASMLEVEADQSGVVGVLRRKCARDLKKVHMLTLCERWGYKSNIWVHKGAAKALAVRSALQLNHTASVLGPGNRRLPAIVDGQSVALFVKSTLAAFAMRSATLLSGPAAAELAATRREGYFTQESLREYSKTAALCSALSASWEGSGRAHRLWADSLLGAAQRSDVDPGCAWQVLVLSKEESVDLVLAQLDAILSTGERARHISEDREKTEAFGLVAAEFKEAFHQGLAFVQSARLLLAQLRATAGFCDYADAGEHLLHVSKSYAEATAEAFNRRREWSAAALENGITSVGMPTNVAARFYVELNTLVSLAASPVRTGGDVGQPTH